MTSIEYQTTDITGIELIRPLWIQLNEHHHAKAGAFREVYTGWTFDDRKAYFEKAASQGSLRIDLAFDPGKVRYAGYCVSSLSDEMTGEIESIYIEGPYRLLGIGTVLMTRALAWLDGNGPTRKRVSVAAGNEDILPFYRKFGFYPRMTVLEQTRE